MPTRRQDPDHWQFNQGAYASSAEFDRGVLANLVAARCQKLSDRETIALLWWLQQISWRAGGLEKFAADFLETHAQLIGTPAMHRFGMRPGQVYNADQVRKVRSELRCAHKCSLECFRLQGERYRVGSCDDDATRDEDGFYYSSGADSPCSYPVLRFRNLCDIGLSDFTEDLKRMLVDPETVPTDGLPTLPGLWRALCECRDREAALAMGRIVETGVTRQIFEELDYALEARTFVLIEGREGIGKTEAARAWCDQRPGRALYVRVEAGVDETTLYRSIAQQLGTACSYQRKAIEMRARIQDALQPAQLMLVLDEAHFLWPQSGRCERMAPKRVDWLRTTLVDFDVAIALISTPQYFARACARFRKGGWNSFQIQRRLARTATLPEPDAVPLSDVLAVVRRYFPTAGETASKRIATFAMGTVGFLTSVKHLRQRVDFLASRRGANSEAEILAEALREAGLQAPEPAAPSASKERLKLPLSRRQGTLSLPPISRAGTQASRLSISPEPSLV